jgi:TolC family type I secretion outer membrane protein
MGTFCLAAIGLSAAGLASLPARADGPPETLRDALSAAYRDNMTIAAQRFALRGTDEQLPQALSGWRPSVSLSTQLTRGRQFFNFGGSPVEDLTNRVYALQVTQPLYHAGTEPDIDRAKATIEGGQQLLSSVEQQQLLAAALAYLDVFRDQGAVELNRNLVKVLTVNRRNVDSTFRAGTATETDTSQAAARLSGAVSGQLGAEAQLATSLARFRDVVGRDAGTLAVPVVLGEVPPTAEEALALGLSRNPALLAARKQLEAAQHQVEVARGDLLPKLDGIAIVEHEDELFAKGVRLNSAVIGVQATVPLYEAGRVYSQVRAAREAAAQAEAQVTQDERDIRAQIDAAWNALRAARAQQKNFRDQIRANEVALHDTEREVEAGTRTRLDTLNAQQELFGSRISLVIAEHDTMAASFQLEAAAGAFTPEGLGLDVPSYDPAQHLDAVRDKWYGTEPPAPLPTK